MVDKAIMSAHSNYLKGNRNVERVLVTRTGTGKPAYWESGGATTNTGRAVIVTDRHYQKLTPLYIKRKGNLSNKNHALLPLHTGYKIIYVWHHREDFEITIFSVKGLSGDHAFLEHVASYTDSEQRNYVDGIWKDAIEAAKRKALTYHCRTPFYIDKSHLN